jgi:hypothetical protein
VTRPLSRRALVALASGAACLAAVVPGTTSAATTSAATTSAATTSAATPGPTLSGQSSPSHQSGSPSPNPSGSASPGDEEREQEVPSDPLKVVVERLTPGSLPPRGDVRISGTITNTSEEEWSDLGVYLFTSFDPMTTAAQLADGIASDPRTDVGDRIVEPGLFTTTPDLAPGEAAPFDLSVPADRLVISGEPGVYWVGVHVLGTNPTGRLEGADGRARTFLPLVPERVPGSELALGLQFRNHIVRASDGRLEYLDGWHETLAEGGRLRRLLDLAATAPADQQVGWVLDPAVIDAAQSVTRGNRSLELVAPEDESEEGEDSSSEGDGEAEEQEASLSSDTSPEQAAAAWVEDLLAEAERHSLLSLPYGDLDVSSVVRHGVSDLLTSAFESSTLVLDERELTSTPVLLPPSGMLAPDAFAELEPGLPVVLSPAAVGDGATVPLLNRVDGGRMVLAPGPDDLWGTGPAGSRSALAVRQRLLADAALHVLSGDHDETLVRFLPPGWDPGRRWQRAKFFRGLDVPWLTAVDVADVLTGISVEPTIDPAEDLDYPESSLDAELPLATVLATESLIAEGSTVEELVTDDSDIDEQVIRQALLTSSVWSRRRPGLAAERAVAARERVSGWLDEVTVRGPSFVTMSSGTGTFQVTVVNGLDQRVTVGLRASVPDGDLELSTPEPIELGPNSRGAMRIDAQSSDIGVHLVTLQPVSTEGTPLGGSTQLSVRSSRVGLILWFVMGIGGTALLVAIALRIWRRVRKRRRTHGPVLGQARS